MLKLEALTPGALVRGILPEGMVSVVSVRWFGNEAIELTYKDQTGKVANQLLYRSDEPKLSLVEEGRPWSFDGDGALFRLVAEAHRIRLAHLFLDRQGPEQQAGEGRAGDGQDPQQQDPEDDIQQEKEFPETGASLSHSSSCGWFLRRTSL